MATTKKTTGKKTASKEQVKTKRVEQRVSSPKKNPAKTISRSEARVTASKTSKPKTTSRRKTEETFSDIEEGTDSPKTRVISRKYVYAVLAVLIIAALLFLASRMWIVAWVDNKPITKFELYSLLEKRDEGKTTDELIIQKLLKSEGEKQGQKITDAEIEAEIKKVEDAQGGAAQLDQILQVNRTSREDFRKLVELQLIKQKLFGEGSEATEGAVDKYIEDNKDQLPPAVLSNPESSEAAKLRQSVKEQLKQMKINENFNKWLEEAMASSRVSRTSQAPTPPAQMTPPMAPQQ